MVDAKARYVVLDSWRGLAALGVVAFHFRTTAGLGGQAIFDGMYLFVDFFFVLSGFVMASSYGKKLRDASDVYRFMWLRLGRVYPLHIVILAVFIALQVIFKYYRTGEWFPGPYQSLDTVIANIFLVQSLNIYEFLTWNQPSWSISVEFFCYLIFAIGVIKTKNLVWFPCVVLIFIAPVFLYFFNNGKNLDATAMYGLIRCVYGFASGVLVFEIYSRLPQHNLIKTQVIPSVIELLSIISIAIFIAKAGTTPLSLVAPIAFGISVAVFAAERGFISSLMRRGPLVVIGSISYSIYMVHMLVISWWLEIFRAALFKIGGQGLFNKVSGFAREYIFLEQKNYSGLALMLILVMCVSAITYFLVEKPCREWSRRTMFFSKVSPKRLDAH